MRSITQVALVLALALAAASPCMADPNEELLPNPQQVKTDLETLHVTGASAYQIEGAFLEHGAVSLVLEAGTLTPLSPVGGRTIGWVFTGSAMVNFQPRELGQQNNLKRFTGATSFVAPCTSMVLTCTDDFVQRAITSAGRRKTELTRAQRMAVRSLVGRSERTTTDPLLLASITRQVSNGMVDPTLSIQMWSDGHPLAFIKCEPFFMPSYSLHLLRDPSDSSSWYEACRSSSAQLELHLDARNVDRSDLVHAASHEIVVATGEAGVSVVKDRITFTVNQDSLRCIEVSLVPSMQMDRTAMVDSSTVIVDSWDSAGLAWVTLPRWYRRDENLVIEFTYRGPLLRRAFNSQLHLQHSDHWYPRVSPTQSSRFDVTCHFPEDMIMVGTGSEVETRVIGSERTSRWVSEEPIVHAAFCLGEYAVTTLDSTALRPFVTVYHVDDDLEEELDSALSKALDGYTHFFGPMSTRQLHVAQTSFLRTAVPGLMMIRPNAATERLTTPLPVSMFIDLNYEVATQWFGASVRSGDDWLTRGLTVYMTWYALGGAREYRRPITRRLEYDRLEILRWVRQKSGFDYPPPPLASNIRAESESVDPTEVQQYFERRGAWFFHMLWGLLLDRESMSEEAFVLSLRRCYALHRDRYVTTDDLRAVIEEVTGRDLRWFFEQWVDDYHVPTYHWAWTSQQQHDGTYRTTLRVRQSDVPETFEMYIPIKVRYVDGTYARYQIRMTGAESVMDIPGTTKEVDMIIFNEFEAVLCEARVESF